MLWTPRSPYCMLLFSLPAPCPFHTLSLHDALPIFGPEDVARPKPAPDMLRAALAWLRVPAAEALYIGDMVVDIETALAARSEEHTSELQSRGHLVCRLLLEKKNQTLGQMGKAHVGA